MQSLKSIFSLFINLISIRTEGTNSKKKKKKIYDLVLNSIFLIYKYNSIHK